MEETKRATDTNIMDRYTKDEVRRQDGSNSVCTETMQERDVLVENHKNKPLPAHPIPYEQGLWKFAR